MKINFNTKFNKGDIVIYNDQRYVVDKVYIDTEHTFDIEFINTHICYRIFSSFDEEDDNCSLICSHNVCEDELMSVDEYKQFSLQRLGDDNIQRICELAIEYNKSVDNGGLTMVQYVKDKLEINTQPHIVSNDDVIDTELSNDCMRQIFGDEEDEDDDD